MLKQLILIRLKGLFLRQTRSSKNKKTGIGKMILMACLFVYLAVVCFGMFGALFYSLVEPLHLMNLDWLYFALMGLIIIIFCFIGSVFITEHEIYEAKDNELLLSMPIKNSDILLSRVFMILILNYIYEILIAGPALFMYIWKIGMSAIQVIMFVVVGLTLPLLIMALTCLIAWIVAHIMKRVRHKNFIVIVVWIAFFMLYFYGIPYIEKYIMLLIVNGQSIADAIQKGLFPIYHLGIAIQDGNILSLIIYLTCALIPFGLVMYILSTQFIKMATKKSKVQKIEYVEKPMKESSMLNALLHREFKHFTSNVMIMMNGAIGVILQLIATGALCFYVGDIQMILQQLPFLKEYVTAAICILGIALTCTNNISSSSVSLEGDRLWIIKSLPISSKDVLHSKLLFHLLMCLPVQILFCLVAGILFNISILDFVLVIGIPASFVIFIALFGLLMNLWKPKFDWINETVCVKQSMSVTITVFSSMGCVFMIGFIYFYLSDIIPIYGYMYGLFALFIVVDILCYYLLKTWGVEKFNNL